MNSGLHTADFFGWANQQAALLRAGRIAEIDREHLAEEIEDMGKSLHRELLNRLTVLFLHFLKWQYQPGYQSNSWRYTIEEQREQIADHLQDNPSLKQKLPESVERAYKKNTRPHGRGAGDWAVPKSTFSESCPWSFEQAIDDEFWPA